MRKLLAIAAFFFAIVFTSTSFAHDFDEFSHKIQPKVQIQILDVLDELLKIIPPPKQKQEADDGEIIRFEDRLFYRLDLGDFQTMTKLNKLIDRSPLAAEFGSMASAVYLEELLSLIGEYTEYNEKSYIEKAVYARLAKIDSSLKPKKTGSTLIRKKTDSSPKKKGKD